MRHDISVIPEIPGVLMGVCAFSDIEDSLITRFNPNEIPAGTKSIILYLFPYFLGEDVYESRNVSRYAVPQDYHAVAGKLLRQVQVKLEAEFPGERFEPFVDASPIPEKTAAAIAGLGVIGKNTLLINNIYGSFCIIGEIITTLELEPTGSKACYCEGCGKCVRACPAGALDGGFQKEKCLSFILQGKRVPDNVMRETVKKAGSAWGCDLCQEACPHNIHPRVTEIEEFISTAKPRFSSGDDISDRAYSWRGRDVIERNLTYLNEERKDR